jgi:hypothetical protein
MVRVARLLPLLAGVIALAGCGAGAISGTVSISPGVPVFSAKTCVNDTFTFSGTATGLLSGGGKTFIGGLAVSASGSSCDTTNKGSGPLTATANGSAGGTTVSCPALSGSFSRTATNVTVSVSGTCTVTDKKGSASIAQKLNIAVSEFIPTKGNGITTPVTGASFAGQFTG